MTKFDTHRINSDMRTFSDIIDAFGGPAPFRDAIAISDVHARQMKLRDSIPAGYWPRTVKAALVRGVEGVTLEVLAELAKNKLDEAAGAKAGKAA